MTTRTQIPLAKACAWAEKIRAELAPFCERIAIAGSIRRARPFVNDIDLVALPQPGQADALRARCKARAEVLSEGAHSLITRLTNGVQIDLWFAHGRQSDLLTSTPGNWGSILLCRTGSAAHNIRLCQRADSLGLHWATTRGLMQADQIIASETEEDIFKALGLDFIPPVSRETKSSL